MMKTQRKTKLTKYEIGLIIILAICLIAVIASHKRIGEKLGKTFNFYSGKPVEQVD
ncbi:MAG: hypothetical protein GX879_05880 [Bacteroidales bacterium]|nr:hypothetical protein [Bacteroidales bacterium]